MKQAWQRLGVATFWLCWPALYIYLRGTERTRIIVRSDDKILLVKGWLSDGRWGLPGGGLHTGEAVQAGAARELYEETGVRVAPTELVSLATGQLNRHGLRFACTYLLADVPELTSPTRQRFEIVEAEWFTLSDVLAQQCQSEVGHALQLLAARA